MTTPAEEWERRLDDPQDPLLSAVSREGQPISLRQLWELEKEWAAQGKDYRRVDFDEVDGKHISTVLLLAPMMPAFGSEKRKPFETAIVSNPDGDAEYEIVARYYTMEEAQRGHREIVESLLEDG